MKKEDFEIFINTYLGKFRKYYHDKDANKKELKRTVYDNKNLTEQQKDKFWSLVIKNKKRGKQCIGQGKIIH